MTEESGFDFVDGLLLLVEIVQLVGRDGDGSSRPPAGQEGTRSAVLRQCGLRGEKPQRQNENALHGLALAFTPRASGRSSEISDTTCPSNDTD